MLHSLNCFEGRPKGRPFCVCGALPHLFVALCFGLVGYVKFSACALVLLAIFICFYEHGNSLIYIFADNPTNLHW